MKQVNTRQADAAGAPESSRAFTRSLMNRFVQAGLLALPTSAAFSSRPGATMARIGRSTYLMVRDYSCGNSFRFTRNSLFIPAGVETPPGTCTVQD